MSNSNHDPKNKECAIYGEEHEKEIKCEHPCTCRPEQKEEWEYEYTTLLGTLMEISAFSAYLGSFHHEKIKDFIRTQIALAEERGRREEISRHAQTLSALATMWNQYCSKETGHEFMCAGEEASEILSRYHLLKAKEGKIINGMCGNAEVKYPLSAEENENFFLEILTQKS